MIRIDKNPVAPNILITKGNTEQEIFNTEYDLHSENYVQNLGEDNSNLKKFEAKKEIYGHKSVKMQLIEDQFDKCCYCETKKKQSYWDVEHFRPKTAYLILNKTKLIYPGYYWLAYDWENLFFSCQICNETYKKNYFPLYDETTRMKNHHDAEKINLEQSILIHPSLENPEESIYFIEEFVKGRNEHGQMNIKLLGLDSKELDENRKSHLQCIKNALLFSQLDINEAQQIELAIKFTCLQKDELLERIKINQNLIYNAAKKQSEYTNMVRSNFPELPRD